MDTQIFVSLPDQTALHCVPGMKLPKWNKKVGTNDLVYHLGDVVMNRKHIAIIASLNGRKRLILGNHDTHVM